MRSPWPPPPQPRPLQSPQTTTAETSAAPSFAKTTRTDTAPQQSKLGVSMETSPAASFSLHRLSVERRSCYNLQECVRGPGRTWSLPAYYLQGLSPFGWPHVPHMPGASQQELPKKVLQVHFCTLQGGRHHAGEEDALQLLAVVNCVGVKCSSCISFLYTPWLPTLPCTEVAHAYHWLYVPGVGRGCCMLWNGQTYNNIYT